MAASSPTFGPQWPQRNPNIVTLVRRDGLRIPLHKELVPLWAILADVTEAMGYDIKPGQTWGYANRPISGTNQPSNHSRGCADDKNAPANPYASAEWHRRNARGTKPFGLQLVCDIPQKVIELWEDNGFVWGGRYTTKPDPMHFEFVLTVAQCRALIAKWRALLKPKPPKPTPPKPTPAPPEDDEMLTLVHVLDDDDPDDRGQYFMCRTWGPPVELTLESGVAIDARNPSITAQIYTKAEWAKIGRA